MHQVMIRKRDEKRWWWLVDHGWRGPLRRDAATFDSEEQAERAAVEAWGGLGYGCETRVVERKEKVRDVG